MGDFFFLRVGGGGLFRFATLTKISEDIHACHLLSLGDSDLAQRTKDMHEDVLYRHTSPYIVVHRIVKRLYFDVIFFNLVDTW